MTINPLKCDAFIKTVVTMYIMYFPVFLILPNSSLKILVGEVEECKRVPCWTVWMMMMMVIVIIIFCCYCPLTP